MDATTLLNRPKTVNITPKITKINSLSIASGQARKSSTKLVKVFEKGTYQKKTQLSILNRYKRRLESIQKQNDRSFGRKRKVKLKLPDIKKYTGSFFTPGSTNDPLKAIGALAAFNTAKKVANKDYLGAIGPGLVAFGLLGGGALAVKGARGLLAARNAPTSSGSGIPMRGFISPTGSKTVFGGISSRLGRVGSSTGTPGIRSNIGLTARQFQAGAFMQTPGARAAFPVALPGTPSTAERLGGAAQNVSNRFGARGGAVAAEAVTARTGGTIAAKAAGVGSRAIPLLGTALNIGLSAYRFSQGDVVGGILSAVSAIPIIGWAALGVDVVREFGAFDGTILGRKDALNKQTQQQKALVEKKGDEKGKLTFSKTLNSYDKAVTKFEKFAQGFTGAMGMSEEQVRKTASKIEDLTGDNPISGAGYEFTTQKSFSQYLTGDPEAGSAYDPSHGTPSNYHDHFAFKDATTAHKAAAFLQSKGIAVTQLDVTSGHSDNSAHYQGRAFDVPGRQWGGTGAIGPREYAGSAKVRALMNDFYQMQSSTYGVDDSPTTPAAKSSPMSQRQQTPGTSNKTPTASLSQARPRRMPVVSQNLSYQEGYAQVNPTIVPYPVVRQQAAAASAPSAPMMMSGPSEQQLLNSFYKRVLLNTVQ